MKRRTTLATTVSDRSDMTIQIAVRLLGVGAIAFTLGTLFTACSGEAVGRTLNFQERMAAVDKIAVVSGNGSMRNRTTRYITDTATINAIVTFYETRKSGWGTPWYGAPVPTHQFLLENDGRVIESIGLGHNFITAGAGQMISRAISEEEVRELSRLADIPLDAP